MKNVLRLISSPRVEASLSVKLGNAVVEKIKTKYPNSVINERDLTINPFPHIDEVLINAFFTPKEKLSKEQSEAIKLSDEAITELQEADMIVIDTPMYNFSIPSTLKTYLDHVVRRGVTFEGVVVGNETKIEGKLKNKKVYLAFTSSGVYSEGQLQSYDFSIPLMKAVLGWMGMTDVTAFRAEGIRFVGEETALKRGIESIVID
ncbi:MAG: FMN-dependent NADH-azoreductase [Bacteroidia bacterium]